MPHRDKAARRAYDTSPHGRALSRARDKKRAHKQAEKLRLYRATEKGKRSLRNTQLKRKFGVSLEQWEAMFSAQNNSCAACGSLDPGSKVGVGWHTDHDHITGVVRGILCAPCNCALGYIFEDVARAYALIAYLRGRCGKM